MTCEQLNLAGAEASNKNIIYRKKLRQNNKIHHT